MRLIKEFIDIFAKHQYSRRTYNMKPARLGIKPEFRDNQYFAKQWQLNVHKRASMINYTIENDNNKFWRRIKCSENCIPYTMLDFDEFYSRPGLVTIFDFKNTFDGIPLLIQIFTIAP